MTGWRKLTSNGTICTPYVVTRIVRDRDVLSNVFVTVLTALFLVYVLTCLTTVDVDKLKP